MLKTTAASPQGRCCLPESRPSRQECSFEVLNGEQLEVPLPGIHRQRIILKLAALLLQKVENRGLGTILGGPCNVMLSPWDMLRPDILFIRAGRTGIIGDQIILGPPDMVIEILDEQTDEKDQREKRRIYAESCVPEYWIVDPQEESVEILIWSEIGFISAGRAGKGSSLSSVLLPDLTLPVSNLFGF